MIHSESVKKSQLMETPRMFSKGAYHPEILLHFPGGNAWGQSHVENCCARKDATEECCPPE